MARALRAGRDVGSPNVRSGTAPGRPSSPSRRLLAGGLAVVAIAIAGFLLWKKTDTPAGSPEIRHRDPALPQSLAVLPFESVGAAPDSSYFADGMTEELITQIGQISGLRVISRTSAFAFRGRRELTIRQIAETLGVTTVLEGSVRRDAQRLRVVARLINVARDSQLLSRDFDRDLTDIFAVQHEIARDIATALQLRFGVTGPGSSLLVPTRDLVAYDLYLQGRALLNRRNPSALGSAVDLFQQAIAHDSRFAAAHAGLAEAQLLRVVIGNDRPSQYIPLALAAATEARRLDTLNAASLAVLGHLKFSVLHDYPGGKQDLRRALELDSFNLSGSLYLSIALADEGRFPEAIAELRRSLGRDPLSAPLRGTLARILLFAGEYDEAIREAGISTSINPQWSLPVWVRGHALVEQGKTTEALASFRAAVAAGGPQAIDSAFLAYGLAKNGDSVAARRVLGALHAERRQVYNLDGAIGVAYLGLGDRTEALRWFERMARGSGSGAYFRFPATAPIRRDPRFLRILRAMGLPPEE